LGIAAAARTLEQKAGNPGFARICGHVHQQLTTARSHPESGLHGLRHALLTEPGEHTDPFTLQYVAGHDTIERIVRDVQAIAVPCAGRTEAQSRCRIRCSSDCPSRTVPVSN
jgi:hypothetical protein